MINKKQISFPLSCFHVFLTGCLNNRIFDKVQIIETLAYGMEGDKSKEQSSIQFSEKGKTKNKNFKTDTTTF
jgi:hypothetical protein